MHVDTLQWSQKPSGPSSSAESPPRIRVLCVDDHQLLCQGVQSFLGLDSRFEVVGSLLTADGLLEQVRKASADLVLLDVELPGADPFDEARKVVDAAPTVRILFLSGSFTEANVAAARRCGGAGYVCKLDPSNELLAAILATLHDAPFFTSSSALKPVEISRRRLAKSLERNGRPPTPLETLTPRELEVLALIGGGLSREQIATRLRLSIKTVDVHQAHVLNKLHQISRTELVRFAIREGVSRS